MNILIITAHPSSKGFTHKIAQRYAKTVKKNEGKIEIIDLYKKEYKLEFLAYEELRELKPNSTVLRIQQKITQADHLVFASPMWWFDAPAIMKNFFDQVFTSGFAFKYVKGKSLPEKLLTNKTADVFITCDAPGFFYTIILGNPMRKIWNWGRLGFCGIKIKHFYYFDKMRKRSEEEREAFLQKVEACVK